jgi:hypothetical protein
MFISTRCISTWFHVQLDQTILKGHYYVVQVKKTLRILSRTKCLFSLSTCVSFLHTFLGQVKLKIGLASQWIKVFYDRILSGDNLSNVLQILAHNLWTRIKKNSWSGIRFYLSSSIAHYCTYLLDTTGIPRFPRFRFPRFSI